MSSFAKIFGTMFDGSMRGKPDLLLVWVNMLARCDGEGVVDRTPLCISQEVGLPVERVQAAIDELEAPDQMSRTLDSQGRRIVRIDEGRTWGWRVVNHLKYRWMRDEELRREQVRLAVANHRNRMKSDVIIGNHPKSDVSDVSHGKPKQKQKQKHIYTPLPPKGGEECSDFLAFWSVYPRKTAKPKALRAWNGIKEPKPEIGKLVAAVRRFAESDAWTRENGQFIPYPATFLNHRRWEDGAEAPAGVGFGAGHGAQVREGFDWDQVERI